MQDRALRFEREAANPCLGGTHHECIDCGNDFSCYSCPDLVNPTYSQAVCVVCLEKMLSSSMGIGAPQVEGPLFDEME